jgi:hypothetical protein
MDSAQYYLDPDLLTHFVHAARTIPKDEEITISYSPPLQPHAARQQYLLDAFHFGCRCSRCQNGESSDEALSQIAELQSSLDNWGADSTASVKQAETLIKLYQQEGLHGFLDTAYGHAALTYNSVGSVRGAQKYAKLAAEAVVLKYGPSAPDLHKWEELAKNPEGHVSWKRRRTGR